MKEITANRFINEGSQSNRDSTSNNKQPLSLILSLHISDQILLQNHSQPSKSISLERNICDPPTDVPDLLSNTSTDLVSHWIATCICPNASKFKINSSPNPTIDEIQKSVQLRNTIIGVEDSIPISAKQLQTIERREHRHRLQREIIILAKKAMKPSYRNRLITKDQYKTIMKKVVTKATYSNKIDQKWIDKTVNSYVRKCRTIQSR